MTNVLSTLPLIKVIAGLTMVTDYLLVGFHFAALVVAVTYDILSLVRVDWLAGHSQSRAIMCCCSLLVLLHCTPSFMTLELSKQKAQFGHIEIDNHCIKSLT